MRSKVKTYVISFLVSLIIFVFGLIIIVINADIDVPGIVLFILGNAGITVILHFLIRDALKRFGIDPNKLTQTEKNRLENSRKLPGYLTLILSIPLLLSLTGLTYLGLFYLIIPIWLFISFLLYVLIDTIIYIKRYKSIVKLRDEKPFFEDVK